MHPEVGTLSFAKYKSAIGQELSVHYQSWEVKEADCNGRSQYVVKVFRQGHLMDEKLEFKEVFARLTDISLHFGGL